MRTRQFNWLGLALATGVAVCLAYPAVAQEGSGIDYAPSSSGTRLLEKGETDIRMLLDASNLGGRSAPKTEGSGDDLRLIRGRHDLADPNHIHSVYLNPRRNFGRDLLAEHYRNNAHSPD